MADGWDWVGGGTCISLIEGRLVFEDVLYLSVEEVSKCETIVLQVV